MSDADTPLPLLGISDEPIEIEDSATLARLSLALAEQCSRRLDIVSRHLDPLIYDTDAFAEAVKRLALSRRQARVRLLVVDSRPLVSHGHRLVDVAMRLTSFIEIRSPAPQHKDFNEAILVADNQGYVHRKLADRFEGWANFSDRRTAMKLTDRFEELWVRGVPDANFRRLHI